MYVAVLSSDKLRAKRLGDKILDTCLSNGCYSTFIHFAADASFLSEMEKLDVGTVILTADSPKELELARLIVSKKPNVKLILLGSDSIAVEGYSLSAHYCAASEPMQEDLMRIADVIFPVA